MNPLGILDFFRTLKGPGNLMSKLIIQHNLINQEHKNNRIAQSISTNNKFRRLSTLSQHPTITKIPLFDPILHPLLHKFIISCKIEPPYRSQEDLSNIYAYLSTIDSLKEVCKNNPLCSRFIRETVCNSIVIKDVSAGFIIIGDESRDTQQYMILEGESLILQQKPKNQLESEITEIGEMCKQIQEQQKKSQNAFTKALKKQPPQKKSQHTGRKAVLIPDNDFDDLDSNNTQMSMKQLLQNSHKQKMIKRMMTSNLQGFNELSNFTDIDNIGKLQVAQIDQSYLPRLFEHGVFKYTIQAKQEELIMFRQQSKQQKIIAESDCLFIQFDDEQGQIRKFIQEHKLKKKYELVDLIHKVLFKRLIDKSDIIKHLPLFHKQKYSHGQHITQQGQNPDRIYLLCQGEVQISAKQHLPLPTSLQNVHKYFSHPPVLLPKVLSLITDPQLIGEDILFEPLLLSTSTVTTQKASCHYVSKEDLMFILEPFPNTLSLIMNNFLQKQALYNDAIQQDLVHKPQDKKVIQKSASLQNVKQFNTSDTRTELDDHKRQLFKTSQLKETIDNHRKQLEFLSNFQGLVFDYKQTEIYKNCLEKLQNIDKSFLPPPKKGETFKYKDKLNFDQILESAKRLDKQCFLTNLGALEDGEQPQEASNLNPQPIQEENKIPLTYQTMAIHPRTQSLDITTKYKEHEQMYLNKQTAEQLSMNADHQFLLPHVQSQQNKMKILKNDWSYLPSINYTYNDNREDKKTNLNLDAIVVKEVYKKSLLNRKLKLQHQKQQDNKLSKTIASKYK